MLRTPARHQASTPPVPAAVRIPADPDHELELWALRATAAEALSADAWGLDPGERARAARLKRPIDRASFLAAHILLRALLSRRLGCEPGQVAYGRERCPRCGGPDGRPVLAGSEPARLQFSVSRSAGLAIAGVATVPIGVDLQAIGEQDSPPDLVELLHPAEREEILSAESDALATVLTRIWTRKEAYLKGIGTGIAHGLDTEYLGTKGAAPPPRDWTVLDLRVPAGFTAAIALGPST